MGNNLKEAIQTTKHDVGYYAHCGPNLSKPCVACTFEFLISASPYLKLTTSGVSLGGQPVKQRQLACQVGGASKIHRRARWHLSNSPVSCSLWARRSFLAHGSASQMERATSVDTSSMTRSRTLLQRVLMESLMSSSTISMTYPSMTLLGRPGRSPFST